MGPVTLLIILLAVSAICGCIGFGVGLTKERKRNSSRLFFAIEFLDAVMDVASYVSAEGNGDLIPSPTDCARADCTPNAHANGRENARAERRRRASDGGVRVTAG